MVALRGIAFWGKQRLGRSNADSSKKGFIKTVGKLQMVFISEAVLPKASGARKTAQGGTSLVTQA